jgi:hypothetical protein
MHSKKASGQENERGEENEEGFSCNADGHGDHLEWIYARDRNITRAIEIVRATRVIAHGIIGYGSGLGIEGWGVADCKLSGLRIDLNFVHHAQVFMQQDMAME